MVKTVLGIDPGMSGALAFYDGAELIIYDMPTVNVSVNGKLRKRLDVLGLRSIVAGNGANHAYIEKVGAHPGNGTAAAFAYGYGAGVIDAVVACCGLPYTHVMPQTWKKAMQCPKDKDAARVRASQLLPQFAHNWDRKKDDGRAEAALVALYGFKNV